MAKGVVEVAVQLESKMALETGPILAGISKQQPLSSTKHSTLSLDGYRIANRTAHLAYTWPYTSLNVPTIGNHKIHIICKKYKSEIILYLVKKMHALLDPATSRYSPFEK